MFSGIVRCADCGEKLYYCTSKNFEARQDHFVCSTSRLKGKDICSTHFIRAVVLEQGVLAHMRLTIACVANHEEQFRKAMGAKQKAEAKKELAAKRRQLTQAERRIEELDDYSSVFTRTTPTENYLTADFKCSPTITSRSRKNCGKSCCY